MILVSTYSLLLYVFVLYRSNIRGENASGLKWYLGCYNRSACMFLKNLHHARSEQQTTPELCCNTCLEQGYHIAALSSEMCYCADLFSEVFLTEPHDYAENTTGEGHATRGPANVGRSSTFISGGAFQHVTLPARCPCSFFQSLCLPVGDEADRLAVYRTQGPYIRPVSLSTVPETVQAGKSFLLELYGYLAASPWQPTGIEGLSPEDFVSVYCLLSWTQGGEISYNASVAENGFFSLSVDWMLEDPGKYRIDVMVSNGISKQFASIPVEALPPRPEALEVILLQEPQDVPSCIPFAAQVTQVTEKVYLGHTYTLQASVTKGSGLDFLWHFSDDERSLHPGPDCLLDLDCLTSTVRHKFGKAGIYVVSVNTSNIYGWIQKIIHIAVVERVLSNLTLWSSSGYSLAVGQNFSLDLEVFTTMRQLLIVNVTWQSGATYSHVLGARSSSIQQVLHTSALPSCQVHVRVQHRYSTVGVFPVSVTILAPSAMQRATLANPVQVYEAITDLVPAPCWRSTIASGINATFRVTSPVDRTSSMVQWTILRGAAVIANQTTPDWCFGLSLPDPGEYLLRVTAFNPISRATFETELLVQDVISDCSLSALSPQYTQTGSVVIVQASLSSGTNVTYHWKLGTNVSLSTRSEIVTHVFNHPGVHTVSVQAENGVSQVLSEHLEFFVQDAVGDVLMYMLRVVTVETSTEMSFSIAAGSNVMAAVFANDSLLYNSSSCSVGEEIRMYLLFVHTGPVQLTVEIENLVSHNVTVFVKVVPELQTVKIELTQPLAAGKSVVLFVKANDRLASNANYFYIWMLLQNHTLYCSSPLVSLSYDEPGSHLINVTVTDYASSLRAELLLNVTELSAAPSLSHYATAWVRTPVQFTVKNVSCHDILNVDFGDGNKTTVFCFLKEHGPSKVSVISWTAEVFRGSCYIYSWRVANGKRNTSLFRPDQLTMELGVPAQLTITVSVVKEMSTQTVAITTRIVFLITGVTLTVTEVPLGWVSHVQVRVSPKLDFDLYIDFGDGENITSSSGLHVTQIECSQSRPCFSVLSFSHVYPSMGACHLSATVSSGPAVFIKTSEAVVEEPGGGVQLVLISPDVTRVFDCIAATASVEMGADVMFQWQVFLPNGTVYSHVDRNTSVSFLEYHTWVPGIHNISVVTSSSFHSTPFTGLLSVKVCGPISSIRSQFPYGTDHTVLQFQPNGSYATQVLQFGACTSSEDVSFIFDFGDGSPLLYVAGRPLRFRQGSTASVSHQYTKEGTFFITITAYNEFYNGTDVQQFHVEKIPENLQLVLNSTAIYKNETVVFNVQLASGTNVTYNWSMGDGTTYVGKGSTVCHRFLSVGLYNVSVTAQNRAGCLSSSIVVSVLHRMRYVRIHTGKQAYPTNTDITFLAVTDGLGTLEFLWHFGDRPPEGSTSKTITRRYYIPDRYIVIVSAFNGVDTVTSDVCPIIIQRKIQPNRLLFRGSVLVNTTVNFDCRINGGTNVTYEWSFGDGTYTVGANTEQHVFQRTGEFIVEVKMSNLVSSTSLTGQIFVVSQACQPPPVKNMGPRTIQVQRYQSTWLGVTYEADINCSISQGVLYSWTVYERGGPPVQLPPVDTHQQSIFLPRHFLHYGTYKAIAKVQIQGSIVYSNYTVFIEVIPSPPVSLIDGGTNIFINSDNGTVLVLNGEGSYDPDYPQSILSYWWDCKPVSSIDSSCFSGHVAMTAPLLSCPTGVLKPAFDQFKFMLTVRSGERSSTSELFVTLRADLMRRVHVFCDNCQGTSVNWNEPFSVKAQCESCVEWDRNMYYSWKLFLVNASSKVIPEVPFCSAVDLGVELSSWARDRDHPPPWAAAASPVMAPETLGRPMASPVPRAVLPSSSEAAHGPSHHMRTGMRAMGVASRETMGSRARRDTILSFFEDEGQPSAGHHQQRRSSETTPYTLSPGSGFLPGNSNVPLHLYHISERPVSDDGSMLYDDIGAELPIDSGFPPVFESTYPKRWTELPLTEDGLDPEVNKTTWTGNGKKPTNVMPHFNHTVYGGYLRGIEEAVIEDSGSRPTGIELNIDGGSTDVVLNLRDQEGDNLMDHRTSSLAIPEKTLLDLKRQQIDPVEFQSYTDTGVSSSSITFKPFVLKARNLYMLEASANSQHILLGKTQFFFSTNEIPERIICNVRPSRGYEIRTDFSVFCTSGKANLIYEYSYGVGKSPRKVLYRGRDFQHYFNLPAGEPENDYNVTIYTEIHNQFGAVTRPCPVNAAVLPNRHSSESSGFGPDEELYFSGLRKLTKLVQKGNSMDVRNYIALLTGALNRMSREQLGRRELQINTRGALISAVCQLKARDQAEITDNIQTLKDLMSVTNQVTGGSAGLVSTYVQGLSSQSDRSADEPTVRAIVSLISLVLQAASSLSEEGVRLTVDGIRTIREVLLKYVLLNKVPQYNLSTNLMELSVHWHRSIQNTVITDGQSKVFLPNMPETHIPEHSVVSSDLNSSCVISQLLSFKHDLYFWGRPSFHVGQFGGVVDLMLYNCTTRRGIKLRSLSGPINIEFEKRAQNKSGGKEFSLDRGHMNIHSFNVTRESLLDALQITVHFTKPADQTFPIMLLVRMFERPTPSLYNIKKIHRWDKDSVHIFLPLSSLNEAGSSYLALLNADYSRAHRNKYTTSTVNYTLKMETVQCLMWDGVRGWKSDGCAPQQREPPNSVNCSCNHLTSFTIVYGEMASHHESTDVSRFVSCFSTQILSGVTAACLTIFVLVAFVCKRADVQGREEPALVILQENSPEDKQLYALTVDTGFRSRSSMTARVYVVLYGEDGISQPRELHAPGRQLFTPNSRHTFIVSTPESLGPIWKTHLWHNSGGTSPSWYVSHVAVRDLATGSSWLFLAECWLAVDEGDGKVERELPALTTGLGFRKLLYCKLTEYLEDFHLWASLYSRPSHSSFTHTQRLGVCLVLLTGYTCVNAVLVSQHAHQHGAELGALHVSPAFLMTGVFSTLAVLPVGCLVSLLFRLSKAHSDTDSVAKHKSRPLDIYSVEAHSDALQAHDLSWYHLQHWAEQMHRKKYQQGLQDCRLLNLSAPGSDRRQASDSSDCRPRLEDRKINSPSGQAGVKKGHCDEKIRSPAGWVLSEQDVGSRGVTLPCWCRYLAWVLCFSLCLISVVITVVLGMKMSPTSSVMCMQGLCFSLLSCAFVLQPAVIFSVATAVSLRNRKHCIFNSRPESAVEVVKQWSHNGSCPCHTSLVYSSCHHQDGTIQLSRVLATRQRMRHLRLAQPPTTAELRRARRGLKKQTLIHRAVREAVMHIIMLFLVLFITYGKHSSNHYQLNQTIKNVFTRTAHKPFIEIGTHKEWWTWSLTALLDGLYSDMGFNNSSAIQQAAAVHGTCILIGEPTLGKTEVTLNAARKASSPKKGFFPNHIPALGSMDINQNQFLSATKLALKGKYNGCEHSDSPKETHVTLGHTRSTASERLRALWTGGWLGPCTRVLKVQFTLFNPPTGLFSTVSLLAEQPVPGVLLSSASVQSTRLHGSSHTLDHAVMACEVRTPTPQHTGTLHSLSGSKAHCSVNDLATGIGALLQLLFLLLTVLQLYHLIWAMSQRGVWACGQDSWNWLKVSVIATSIAYYVNYMYSCMLAEEALDFLQRGDKAFVDLTVLSSWEQLTRCLRGITTFLLLVRCVSVLRLNMTTARSLTTLWLSLRKLPCPLLAGIVLIMAFFCLGRLLLLSWQSVTSPTRTLSVGLVHHMGISMPQLLPTPCHPDHTSCALFYGSFFLVLFIWTALIIGVISSLTRATKKTLRKKDFVSFSEVAAYVREKVLVFAGRYEQRRDDNNTQRRNFYLDEFEDLIDELLLRLDAFTGGLDHTLPHSASLRLGGYERSYMGHGHHTYSTLPHEAQRLGGDKGSHTAHCLYTSSTLPHEAQPGL